MPRNDDRFPTDPRLHPAEAVDQLEREAASDADRDENHDENDVAAEDVTRNPDTGELEGLPGPSADEPGESAG